MLSTKKQEEDKNDILDVTEFFEKHDLKKNDLTEEKNEKQPSKPPIKKP